MEGKPKTSALSAASAKAAAAAGVKPAALITKLDTHAVPKPAFELSPATLNPKTPTKKGAKPKQKTKVMPAAGRQTREHLARVGQKGSAIHKAGSKPQISSAKPGRVTANKPALATTPKPSPAIVKPSPNGGQS
jgi:hypothetical protein